MHSLEEFPFGFGITAHYHYVGGRQFQQSHETVWNVQPTQYVLNILCGQRAAEPLQSVGPFLTVFRNPVEPEFRLHRVVVVLVDVENTGTADADELDGLVIFSESYNVNKGDTEAIPFSIDNGEMVGFWDVILESNDGLSDFTYDYNWLHDFEASN